MRQVSADTDLVMHLETHHQSDNGVPLDDMALTRLARDAVQASGRCGPRVGALSMSVACVDAEQMRAENMRLRSVDAPTDVLSCGHYSDMADLRVTEITHVFLGEVILCYTYIVRYAQQDGIDPLKAFCTAFVHGVLHLTGLHHGVRMFRVQDEVVARFMHSGTK